MKEKISKKPKNKIIIIINIIALVIILAVAGFFVYDKYIKKNVPPMGQGGPMGQMDIESMCERINSGEEDANRQPPEEMENTGNNERPEGESFNQEDMEERQTLIEEICADGEVTEEEKTQFEESQPSIPSNN
ncbi:MAG: hypothetical protein WC752_01890 [Patescibacteria group bacterium]|jgi:hypothetical protein